VLWVCVHFDEWTIAWQGPRRRGRLSRGVTDNSAPLVSHDISYGARSGDVTVTVPRRVLSAVTATHRGPPSSPRWHDDNLAPRDRESPRLARRDSHACIHRFRPCEHHVRAFPVPRTRNLRKRAGRGVRCPLRSVWRHMLTAAVTCSRWRHWQRWRQRSRSIPRYRGGFPSPIPVLLIPIYVTDFCAGFLVPNIVDALHLSRTAENSVKFH